METLELAINTNKLDEKLEITKRLGMKECHKHLSGIKEILEMKFKTVKVEDVKREVWWQGLKACWKIFLFQSAIISSGVSGLICLITIDSPTEQAKMARLIFLLIGTAGVFVFSFFMQISNLSVHQSPLRDWEHNIPYGALLATEEAMKKGIGNFTIFYPALRKKLSDPILVGETKKGNLIQIFNWDDGKIYE